MLKSELEADRERGRAGPMALFHKPVPAGSRHESGLKECLWCTVEARLP